MALSGKLIGYVEITKKGDVFHDLFRHNPNDIAVVSPEKIHVCDVLEGDRGAVGSIVHWQYTIDGKRTTVTEIIEAVNEENHMIVFKVIGGELVEEVYKSFTITFHVDKKGDGEVAVWTLDFERSDTSVRYPIIEMDFLCNVVKEFDSHDNTK